MPSREERYLETIDNPLIELLAIKLYEHDTENRKDPKVLRTGWMTMSNEDRELYRKLARGEEAIGYVPEPA